MTTSGPPVLSELRIDHTDAESTVPMKGVVTARTLPVQVAMAAMAMGSSRAGAWRRGEKQGDWNDMAGLLIGAAHAAQRRNRDTACCATSRRAGRSPSRASGVLRGQAAHASRPPAQGRDLAGLLRLRVLLAEAEQPEAVADDEDVAREV